MPPDLPAISPVGNIAVLPTNLIGGAEPSRAIVRVAPVVPRPEPTSIGTPLERSGLNLLDVLTDTDHITTRDATAPVALEVGLERARGSLLRNLPGDALAALDQVWEGAQHTEEGWYLRSGALTVLGLPGEGERVSQEGLAVKPESSALQFSQSLARLANGDIAGARASLQPAILMKPNDPLLLVQQAIVQARHGDSVGAEQLLHRATRDAPDNPVADYGRTGVRLATSDTTRERSRATPMNSATMCTPSSIHAVLNDADATTAALFRFGGRMVTQSANDLVREARILLRAFSAGGTLAATGGAAQTYAARVVLSALAAVIAHEPSDTPLPLRALLQLIVPMLSDGRAEEAASLVRRANNLGREPISRLLQSVIDGAMAASSAPTTTAPARTTPAFTTPLLGTPAFGTPAAGTSAFGAPIVRGELERAPIIPVRLGLALLDETPHTRNAMRLTDPTGWLALEGMTSMVSSNRVESRMDWADITGRQRVYRDVESAGQGWGHAHEVAALSPKPRSTAPTARAMALVLVAGAAAAMTAGHAIVAVALGAVAIWIGSKADARRPSTDETPQNEHGTGEPR